MAWTTLPKIAWVSLLLSAQLPACSKRDAEQTVLPPEAPPSVEPVPSSPPTAPERLLSIAVFKDDALDECADFLLVGPADDHPRLDVAVDKLKESAKGMSDSDKGQTALLLNRECREQFSDRPYQASCRRKPQASADGKVKQVSWSFFYTPRAVDKDGLMLECMKQGGEWISNKEDPEAAMSRARQRIQQVEGLLK